MTQQERIRKYLDEWGKITPMDAFMDLGITKLATQISLMIRNGEKIKKTMTKAKNRWGEPVHFMTYSWLEDENQSSTPQVYQNNKDVSMEGDNDSHI